MLIYQNFQGKYKVLAILLLVSMCLSKDVVILGLGK